MLLNVSVLMTPTQNSPVTVVMERDGTLMRIAATKARCFWATLVRVLNPGETAAENKYAPGMFTPVVAELACAKDTAKLLVGYNA
jgi:hypothetical protein